jgi:dihydroorotase
MTEQARGKLLLGARKLARHVLGDEHQERVMYGLSAELPIFILGGRLAAYERDLDAAMAAKRRGVLIDVGHGGGSFDFTVAEVAIPAGCTPDTISSDIHVFSGNTPGVPFLPNVMSKFMAMGYSLEEVVMMTTTAPAKIINRAPKIGTLQVGAPGDVAIMELVEGPVTFVDTRNNKRDGKAYLKPIQTVINGVPFGRPYQSPFAVR